MLITALIFLVLLTVIVISTVNITNSDEKIARNSRDKDIAFAAAEAALRDAELYISGSYQFPYNPISPIFFDGACTHALCDLRLNALAVPVSQLDFFASPTDPLDGGIAGNSMAIGAVTQSPQIIGVNAQPRYLVEIIGAFNDPGNPNAYVFRITAQGQGRSANTRVTLQELYTPAN